MSVLGAAFTVHQVILSLDSDKTKTTDYYDTGRFVILQVVDRVGHPRWKAQPMAQTLDRARVLPIGWQMLSSVPDLLPMGCSVSLVESIPPLSHAFVRARLYRVSPLCICTEVSQSTPILHRGRYILYGIATDGSVVEKVEQGGMLLRQALMKPVTVG